MRNTEQHIEHLLPEYIAGTLPASEAAEVKQHLVHCASCTAAHADMLQLEEAFAAVQPLQPHEKLRAAVFAMIDEEKQTLKHKQGRQVVFFSWQTLSRIAAAVVLVVAGYWLGSRNQPPVPAASGEVAQMKQELGEIKELLLMANLKAQYPSERIQAVNQVEAYTEVDARLIEALVTTLNTDQSPNVRLAAANALQKFAAGSSTVRAGLVRSFEYQTEPIVQIALINMMVELEEKSAINKLRTLIKKEGTLPEVKKQAELGIEVLI